MYGLRPAAVALISVAGLKIMNTTVFNLTKFLKTHNLSDFISLKAFILLMAFCAMGLKLKKNPMILIVAAIVLGLVIKL